MIHGDARKQAIQRNTRVLFRNRRNGEYLMTNDSKPVRDLLRIFSATADGVISMEGPLLGSLFAHDPYIIPKLEEVECSFEELNPSYFSHDPVVDGLIGQAVGDAFGVPVEFMSRDEVRKLCNLLFPVAFFRLAGSLIAPCTCVYDGREKDGSGNSSFFICKSKCKCGAASGHYPTRSGNHFRTLPSSRRQTGRLTSSMTASAIKAYRFFPIRTAIHCA